MSLLVVFALIVVVSEFVVAMLGVALDHFNPALSLTVSLPLFFAVLGVAWIASVHLTKPKH
ncbi:MAG: hypothetical protein WAJ88_17125 [Pseudolabrys sp.]